MGEIAFTVFGEAQPAGSKRHVGAGRVLDANPRSAPWKLRVAQVAGEKMDGRELLRGPLFLIATFYRVRPRGHFGKRGLRPAAPDYPTSRPDTTKLLRGLEDACQGVVYADDAQIVAQVVRKEYGEPARVEVVVKEMGAAPDAAAALVLPALVLQFPDRKERDEHDGNAA